MPGYLMPPVGVRESCLWNVVMSVSDKPFIGGGGQTLVGSLGSMGLMEQALQMVLCLLICKLFCSKCLHVWQNLV